MGIYEEALQNSCPNCTFGLLKDSSERPEWKGWFRCSICAYMKKTTNVTDINHLRLSRGSQSIQDTLEIIKRKITKNEEEMLKLKVKELELEILLREFELKIEADIEKTK